MVNKWLDALKERESKHNTTAALHARPNPGAIRPVTKPETPTNPPSKTSNTTNGHRIGAKKTETPTNPPSKTSETLEANRLGLIARWSIEFGYVAIHDPTTGEWYDLATKDAPDWAKREAFKRKELYKDGNRKAYRLTAGEMEKIWDAERVEMWTHPAVTDRGIVYEDYLEEEEE